MEKLEDYKIYLLDKDKSENTISGYANDLKLFIDWYDGEIKDVTKSDIKEYINYLHCISKQQ